jgi:hypothetical protein
MHDERMKLSILFALKNAELGEANRFGCRFGKTEFLEVNNKRQYNTEAIKRKGGVRIPKVHFREEVEIPVIFGILERISPGDAAHC